MPRSRSARSPRSSATRKERRVVFNAPFADPFLSGWIDAQLGSNAWRATIELMVSASDAVGSPAALEKDHFLAVATRAVAEAGGAVVGRGHGWMMAAWGLERSDAAAPARALEAAFAIAQRLGGQGQCLLDARLRCLPKPEEPSKATVTGSAADWAAAPLPKGGAAMRWMPQGVIVSEAFRRIGGLERGLIALSTEDGADAGEGTAHYALLSPGAGAAGAPGFQGTGSADGGHDLDWEQRRPSPGFMHHLNHIDGLGDLKPVIIAAAVAGKTFTRSLLARMLDIDAARLATALECASARGLLNPVGELRQAAAGEGETYAFGDEGLRQAAYATVPEADRRRLHRKAAAALSDARQGGALGAEAIAEHHRCATNPQQSRRWLSRAAWAAIARGDSAEAVRCLELALSACPGDALQARSQRLIRQLLGVQLAVARGNGADDVYTHYTRSLQAGPGERRAGAPGAEFRALWGLQSYHLVRGEVQAALTIGQLIKARFTDNPNRRPAGSFWILANRMQGLAAMLNGQLAEARAHYDAVLETYHPPRDGALRFAYGSDQAALALAHRAWTSVLMGRPEEARQDTRRARERAELLEHSHTSAHVLGVLACAALAAGALAEAALTAREGRAIAVESGHPYWVAWCDVVLAAAESGRPGGARIEDLAKAIEAYEAQNARQLLPAAYAHLARAATAAGAADLAHAACRRGLEIAGSGGAIVHRPALNLARAQLLVATGDPVGADASREAAYAEARRFGALGTLRHITLDGFKSASGRSQILWQRRYHEAL